MSNLWFAFGIYIVGVALVLFFRPSLMFQEGAGVWKEFGLGTTSHRTLFPFWLFTIVWALVSYVLATLFSVYVATLSLRSVSGPNDFLMPVSAMSSSNAPPMASNTPSSSVSGTASPSLASKTPGYYILESEPVETLTGARQGTPRYVYFGTEPPSLSNLSPTAPR